MSNELAEVNQERRPMTAIEIRAQVNLIQEVMKAVMKKDTHYGVIPGCNKPSLYKPGAEQLMVTFRIAPEPIVEDLSTGDAIRYRVAVKGTSILTGAFLGTGIGECSSDEEKYRWRFAVCDAEFDATPEDKKRTKYKRDGSTMRQIRTNPADLANTILKMAKKRAYVDLALTTTAASDIFTQDIEDLPEEVAAAVAEGKPAPKVYAAPQAKPAEIVTEAEVVDPAANDGLTAFVPAAYATKNGEKNGKAWLKHSVKMPNGEWVSTFSDTVGKVLKEAADNKRTVKCAIEIKGDFKTATSAELA